MSALTDGKEKNERKIAEIYVGTLWQRQIESVFNDLMEDSKKERIENPYRYLGLRKE